MKKHIKNVIGAGILILGYNTGIAQIQPPIYQTGQIQHDLNLWCNNPDENFCVGNRFTNGNFEEVTGDPNAVVDMDIYLATGWNTAFVAIGSNNSFDFTSADIACGGTTLLSSAGGAIPTPNSGIYAGMWIVNNGPTPSDKGENMLNKLVTPIPFNTGNYTFTCDTAMGIKGADVINIGVYGVYNPNDAVANNTITTNPLNYWNNLSVDVVKLGVITPSPNLSATWETLTFTFDSSILPPNGITHLMIAGDNVPVNSWKRDYLFFDNFCMRTEAEEQAEKSCCETDLAIWNVAGTPDPIPTTQQTDPDATVAVEHFEIHQSSTIPITELRVAITDIIYHYNYESCGKCESNPALWGSLLNPFNANIGGLQFVPDSSGGNVQGNLIANHEGIRELVWRNPNGAMLQQGMTFPVWYLLPPASDIPCCVTSVTICSKITWKDANCKMCEGYTCSHINLVNENSGLKEISISKSNDCCGATLTVNTSSSNNNIQWSNGAHGSSIYVSEPGTYSVTVAGQTQNIVVTSEDVGARYYTDILQTSNQSFYSSSSNNNSYNSFYIMHVEDPQPAYGEYYATDYRLEIWDRWGEMIREIEGTIETCQGFPNPAIFWDGTVNGNKVQTDVYNGKLFLKNCKYKNEWIPVKVNYCTQWGYTCLETECVSGLSFECGFMKKNECTKWSSLMCKEEHKEFIFPITIV